MAFFGYPRGHRVNTEAECLSTCFAYYRGGYSPSNRAFRESMGPAPDNLRLASVLITRSSCLLFQFSWIEAGSFLPNR